MLLLKPHAGIQVKKVESLAMLSKYEIVFLPSSQSLQIAAIKSQTQGMPVAIVTQGNLFKQGAHISFIKEDNKLRFKLNKDALTLSNLLVSSSFLNFSL